MNELQRNSGEYISGTVQQRRWSSASRVRDPDQVLGKRAWCVIKSTFPRSGPSLVHFVIRSPTRRLASIRQREAKYRVTATLEQLSYELVRPADDLLNFPTSSPSVPPPRLDEPPQAGISSQEGKKMKESQDIESATVQLSPVLETVGLPYCSLLGIRLYNNANLLANDPVVNRTARSEDMTVSSGESVR